MPLFVADNPGVPADMRPITMRLNGGPMRKFTPNGPLLYLSGENPLAVTETSTLSRDKRATQGARLIIGFNVKGKPRWKMKDVIPLVFKLRQAQVDWAFSHKRATKPGHGGDIGASIIAQKGLWQEVHIRKPLPENGVQIVILNTIDQDKREFQLDMDYMAETLATELKQDSVLLEHQRRGIPTESVLWGPRPR